MCRLEKYTWKYTSVENVWCLQWKWENVSAAAAAAASNVRCWYNEATTENQRSSKRNGMRNKRKSQNYARVCVRSIVYYKFQSHPYFVRHRRHRHVHPINEQRTLLFVVCINEHNITSAIRRSTFICKSNMANDVPSIPDYSTTLRPTACRGIHITAVISFQLPSVFVPLLLLFFSSPISGRMFTEPNMHVWCTSVWVCVCKNRCRYKNDSEIGKSALTLRLPL